MSRSRRPPKHWHHQHKREWVQEKQVKLSSVEPKRIQEAVVNGLEDHKGNDLQGEHLADYDCDCLGCYEGET